MINAIALVTDFGVGSPYMGQVRAVLGGLAPKVPVIDLIADLPPFRPDLAAYLISALARDLPRDTLYLCVVDPGVGGSRDMLLLRADRNWYLGPDNGLLAIVARRAKAPQWRRLTWHPKRLSASFHGRDLLAPAAARLARAKALATEPVSSDPVGLDWPADRPEVIYGDRYGNLITGWRARRLARDAQLQVGERLLSRARTFSDVAPGTAFWYENSLGLVEIAVNQGPADRLLGLGPGDRIAGLTGQPLPTGEPCV